MHKFFPYHHIYVFTGTYSVSGHAVRIKSFGTVVGIIRSKQRPRKLRIYGEDGQQYIFLLKVRILLLILFGSCCVSSVCSSSV